MSTETFCKLYECDTDLVWNEVGGGYAGVEDAAPPSAPGSEPRCTWTITVRAGSLDMWSLRMSPGDVLYREQPSIIGWAGPSDSDQFSFSFQYASGCSRVWEDICNACHEDPRVGRFAIREEGGVGAAPPATASASAASVRDERETQDAADAMLSVAARPQPDASGSAPQKRPREASPGDDAARDRATPDDSRSGRGGSSSDDDEEEEDERRRASHASSTSFRGGSTTRRRGDAPGSSGSSFTASSALELFGLRSAAAQAGPRAQPQSQSALPPVSFLRAAPPSPLAHVASRLAQLDARALGGAGMLDDETYSENAPAAEASRAAGGSMFGAQRGGHGASLHGLPATPTVADLPSVAASLTSSTSDYQRKTAMRNFLSSDEAVSSWLPSLLAALGEVGYGEGGAASDSTPAADTPAGNEVASSATFIVRYLLSLEELFEPLCGDALFVPLLGAIEVALGLSRKVLVDGYARVCFRQAVPLDNPDLVGRIHFCFRMAFLKDHALPRHYDEHVLATLGSSVGACQLAILEAVTTDTALMRKLLDTLRERSSVPAAGSALLQFRLKADSTLAVFCDLGASGSRVSGAAVWRAFSSSEDGALTPQGSRAPREECLRFLSECLATARGHALQARTSFLQALCRVAPGQQLFAALEAVLCDRHAARLEVAIALELLQVFATDAHLMHQQSLMQAQGAFLGQAPRAKGLGSDPLRRHLVAQAARIDKLPQPSVKPPPPMPFPGSASAGAAEGGHSYGALLASLLRHPADDGSSIRPYEKALYLACAGQLPQEWRSLPLDALVKAVVSFNALRAPVGEHGALVPPPTERTGLLYALVWRAVDDPEPAICSAALELLRSVLDVSVSDSTEVSHEDLGKVVQSFYDLCAQWLVQPFCSSRLQPPIVVPDPKTVAALTADGAGRVELTRQLCPWFGDRRVGCESAASKQSKLSILEHLIATFEPHAFRFKYLQLRQKVFSRMLRLLCYPEKHLALLAVQSLRSVMADEFYRNSLLGEFVLSPLLAAAALRCGGRHALEGALLDFFVSLKGQAVQDALRGPYRRAGLVLDEHVQKVLALAANDSNASRASLVPTMPNAQSSVTSLRMGGPIDFIVGPDEGGDDGIFRLAGSGGGAGGGAAAPAFTSAEMDYFDSDDLDELDPQMVGPPAPPADVGRLVVLQPPDSPSGSRGDGGVFVSSRGTAASRTAPPSAAASLSRDPFAFDDDDPASATASGPAPSAPLRPPLADTTPDAGSASEAAAPAFDLFSFAPPPADPEPPGFRASPLLPSAGAVARRTKLAVVLKSSALPAAAAAAAPPVRVDPAPLGAAAERGGGGWDVAVTAPAPPPSPPQAARPPRASLVDYGDDDDDDEGGSGSGSGSGAAAVGVPPAPGGWTEVGSEPAAA